MVKIATFLAYPTSSTSGQATFYDLSTVSYTRTIYINVNGTQTKSWTIAGGAVPNDSYDASFTGLTPNTTYEARCTVYRNSPWEEIYSNRYSFRTLAPPVQPWEWYTPKISGANFNVSADEWNSFCDRINQMRVARGMGVYSFTTANSGNLFYASTFRQAANALSGFWGLSDELKNVVSGDDIYAWYFANLKSCLNQAISEI